MKHDEFIKQEFIKQVELIGTMQSVYLNEDEGLKLYMSMQNILVYIKKLETENEIYKTEKADYLADYAKLETKLKYSEAERKFEHQRALHLLAELEKLKKEEHDSIYAYNLLEEVSTNDKV